MALTQEQIEKRRKGCGGSDAGVIVGLNPYKTLFELWLEKRGEEAGLVEEEQDLREDVRYWGSKLEDTIADAYAEITGRKVRRTPQIVSKEYPWMHVNMDRQIVNDDRGPGYLEVKNFGYWSGGKIYSRDDVPDYVRLQVQHGLAVTGYRWGAYAILIGGQRLFEEDIERDEAVIEMLVTAEKRFMEMVVNNERPDVDGTEKSTDLLKRMYPRDSGTVLTIDDPIAINIARKLVEVKAAEKEMTAAKEGYNNWFKVAMGAASELCLPGWGRLTWKSAADKPVKVFDETEFAEKHPELYKTFTKTVTKKGSRTFLVKEGEEEPKPKKPKKTVAAV